jgi:L-gulono-1,4-lactone dehydrogenase
MEPHSILDGLGRENPDAVDQAVGLIATQPETLFNVVRERYAAGVSVSPATVPTVMQRATTGVHWENWAGNIIATPERLWNLTQLHLADLQRVVEDAARSGKRVHVVGSGHSFSEILLGEHDFIAGRKEPYQGDLPLAGDVDASLLRSGVDAGSLVDLAACARLSELNEALDARQQAFMNLGGATYQTLAGAILTGTHGSGRDLGMLGDAVRSILIVSASGHLVQLEPTAGISDPVKFVGRYGDTRILVQEDNLFYAFLVSLGCMGIAVRMVVEVLPAYLLHEERMIRPWSVLREELRQGTHLDARHCEVLINPYMTDKGDYSCLLTIRNIAAPGDKPNKEPEWRTALQWLASRHPEQEVLIWFLNTFPHTIPGLLEETLKSLVTQEPYIDKSYRVYDLERVNDIKALSSEIAYPLDGNVYLDAVDSLLALVKRNIRNGWHHTGPIALRFVAPSKAFLSMCHDRRTCMVELPMPLGTHHLEGMLDAYEADSQRFQGRPHWGQWHRVPLTPGWAAGSYPRLADWIRAYRQLNCNGVFDSPFTDQMGFRSAPG